MQYFWHFIIGWFFFNALLCIFRMKFSSKWVSRLSVTSAEMQCERTQVSFSAKCHHLHPGVHSPLTSPFTFAFILSNMWKVQTKQEFWRTAKTVFSYLFVCFCRLRTGDPETFKQTLSHAVPNSLTQKWIVPAYAPSSVFLWCSPSGPGRRWNLLSLCSSSSSTCTFTKHKPSGIKLVSMI